VVICDLEIDNYMGPIVYFELKTFTQAQKYAPKNHILTKDRFQTFSGDVSPPSKREDLTS